MSRSIIESSLAESGTVLQFDAGETLFREGEMPRGVFVLQEGQVDLLFTSRKSEPKPLRVAQAGQLLGLSCVVTQRPHDCSATTATPCRATFIESGDFQRVLAECPAVWFSVLRLLSTDVNAVYDDIRTLAAR